LNVIHATGDFPTKTILIYIKRQQGILGRVSQNALEVTLHVARHYYLITEYVFHRSCVFEVVASCANIRNQVFGNHFGVKKHGCSALVTH
jgi:hypothetical protein